MQTWFIFDRGKNCLEVRSEREKKKRSSSPFARDMARRLDGRAICTWNVEVSLIFMTGGSDSLIGRKPENHLYIFFFLSFDIITWRAVFHNSFRRGIFLQSYTVFVQLDNPLKPLHYVILFFPPIAASLLSSFSHSFLWLKMAALPLCVRTQTQRETVYLSGLVPTNQVRINESLSLCSH